MNNDKIAAREISITVGPEANDREYHGTPTLHTRVGNAVTVDIGPVDQATAQSRSRRIHDDSIVSVGWNPTQRAQGQIPQNIVDGLDNEDLWLFLRRFNKHIFHIKATRKPLASGDIDFNTADDEDFTTNKLRAQLERMYMGIFIGFFGLSKHVARLRSWREPRRTGLFFLGYYTSWYFGLLIPTIFGMLAALVLSRKFRMLMFPPAPLSMVDSISGEIKPPPAGTLGTVDGATGAPEAHKGETLENEASNFAASIIGTAMNILNDVVEPQHGGDGERAMAHHYFHSDEAAMEAGRAANANGPRGMKGSSVSRGEAPKNGGSDADKTKVKPQMMEPHTLAIKAAVAKDKAAGVDRPSKDKSKVPIQKMIWRGTRTATHALCQMSDYWERCQNLINPRPPFTQIHGQLRLATFLLTLCALTMFVSAHTITRIFSFSVGVLIFGRPLLDPAHKMIAAYDISLRSTLFHGIPTDAQQTITILRLGEAARSPIPPPPPNSFVGTPESGRSGQTTPGIPCYADETLNDPTKLSASFNDRPMGVNPEEMRRMAKTDTDRLSENSPSDRVLADKEGHGKLLGKVFHVLKFGVKGATKTVIAADAVKGKVFGSKSSKLRAGAISQDDKHDEDDAKSGGGLLGPVEFRARYDGKKGFVYLTTDDTGAVLCFTRSRGVTVEGLESDEEDDDNIYEHGDHGHEVPRLSRTVGTLQPIWTLPIEEIAVLNKFSGFGEKSKVLAGWALETAVKDGLQIIDRDGHIRLITAIPKRDELFNRLCAMGQQRWEVW